MDNTPSHSCPRAAVRTCLLQSRASPLSSRPVRPSRARRPLLCGSFLSRVGAAEVVVGAADAVVQAAAAVLSLVRAASLLVHAATLASDRTRAIGREVRMVPSDWWGRKKIRLLAVSR